MTSLNPLDVNDHIANDYINNIHDRSTCDLHDDYQLIWIHQPHTGYADLLPVITQLRTAIIAELAQRDGVPVRPRLVTRLGLKHQPERSKVLYWLYERDNDVASTTFVNPPTNLA